MFVLRILVLAFVLIFELHASEVDNFTKRSVSLEDSRFKLNQMTNLLLKERIEFINQKEKGCKENDLYNELQKDFNVLVKGSKLLKWVEKSSEISKYNLALEDSIYQDWNLLDSPAMRELHLVIPEVFGEVIKVDDVRIGVDKLEHFFGYGFQYFDTYYLKKKSIKKALKFGLYMEYFNWGAYGTGVMSYGDLAANFNGMRFWNHILGKNEDILGRPLGPYVVCKNNRWVQGKSIDWKNYIDESFDESINCSLFREEIMVKKVRERIKAIPFDGIKNLSCPIAKNKLKKMVEKYSKYSEYILNFDGHKVIPTFTNWKQFHDL